MDTLSRQLSGKDLSRQLSSVDEEHKAQLMSGAGLSLSSAPRRQLSSRPWTDPGGKRAPLVSQQPSGSASQPEQLAGPNEKHSALEQEVARQQTGDRLHEERADKDGDEMHIAYI